jgi:RNA-binding protein NOB1
MTSSSATTTSVVPSQEQAEERWLVVDTNAIVRGVHFERMAERLFTIGEVLAEVRDRTARGGVLATAVLPSVVVRDPEPSTVRAVVAMAKRTGDYGTLSVADIKLIALTLTLSRERATQPHPTPIQASPAPPATSPKGEEEEEEKDAEEEKKSDEKPKGDEASQESQPVDDGEGEWITPANLAKMQAKARGKSVVVDKEARVALGCLTGDFAMQNVLIQLGLNVVSVDGLRITAARRWALKCFSCFAIERNTSKIFCSACGNSTLRRIQVQSTPDGGLAEVPSASAARPMSTRGFIHPIPQPRGGRNRGMALSEDELQHRLRTMPKPKSDDVGGVGYSGAGSSDVFGSRARHGVSIQQQRRMCGVGGPNPNLAKKRIGKKNKPKGVGF